MKEAKIKDQQIFNFLSTLTDEEIAMCNNANHGKVKKPTWRLHKEFTQKLYSIIPNANTGTATRAWKILRSVSQKDL